MASKPMIVEIEPIGFAHAVKTLAGVRMRLLNAKPAYEVILEMLEKGEQRLFTRLGGKYVDTGDLKASLTQGTANEAIREAHVDQLVFGTEIYYARFHKDKRGKSAVLKLQPTERKLAAKSLLDYALQGLGGIARP